MEQLEEGMTIIEDVLMNLSYGVYIVSSMDGDRPAGCTANSIMQVTALPAVIAVSLNHDSFTNRCIRLTNRFAVSILSEATDPSIIRKLGFRSGKDTDKFSGVPYEMKDDLPVIRDSFGYIICRVIGKTELETHTVFFGEVTGGDLFDCPKPPMTYAYYHKVIKGKTHKNAPTYIQGKDKK